MTYLELANKILKMTPDQQKSDLTIFSEDEFYPAELLFSSESDEMGNILDDGHPYFKPKDIE